MSTVIPTVISTVMPTMIATLSPGGGSNSKFTFNGVDMYATIPDWTPLGLPYSVEVSAVPLGINLAGQNVLVSSSTNVNVQGLLIQGNVSGRMRARVNATPSDANIYIVTPIPVVGESMQSEVSVDAESITHTYNGSSVVDAVNAAQIDANTKYGLISIDHNSGAFFHGPIWDVKLNDSAVIQDTDVLEGNGTRYITIPEFTIPEDDGRRVSWDGIYDNAVGIYYILGSADSSAYIRITGDTGLVRWRNGGISRDVAAGLAGLANGQHYHAEFIIDAAGVGSLEVDGVETGTLTNGALEFAVDEVGASAGGAGAIRVGSAIQNVTLRNTTTDEYLQYKIDEGAGTEIKAYDINGDEIGLGAEEWTNPPANLPADFDDLGGGVYDRPVATASNPTFGMLNCIEGVSYLFTYTVAVTTGTYTANAGGTKTGNIGTGGTKSHVLVGGSGTTLGFTVASGFTGTFSNISVKETKDGTVTPDASWANIPNNSRHYPMNEGSGATLFDVLGGHDGTIINEGAAGGGWDYEAP